MGEKKWCCQICNNPLRSPVVTQCGHIFCFSCISNHLKHHDNCPICNSKNTEDTLTPVYGHTFDSSQDMGHFPKPLNNTNDIKPKNTSMLQMIIEGTESSHCFDIALTVAPIFLLLLMVIFLRQ